MVKYLTLDFLDNSMTNFSYCSISKISCGMYRVSLSTFDFMSNGSAFFFCLVPLSFFCLACKICLAWVNTNTHLHTRLLSPFVISDNGDKSENMHISNYMCKYSQQEVRTQVLSLKLPFTMLITSPSVIYLFNLFLDISVSHTNFHYLKCQKLPDPNHWNKRDTNWN